MNDTPFATSGVMLGIAALPERDAFDLYIRDRVFTLAVSDLRNLAHLLSGFTDAPLPYCADAQEHSNRERYCGWANRETWAFNLHVGNDEGWHNSSISALVRAYAEHYDGEHDLLLWRRCGDALQQWWEQMWDDYTDENGTIAVGGAAWMAIAEIGSLDRVDFAGIAESVLSDNEYATQVREGWAKECDECGSEAKDNCLPTCTALETLADGVFA